ncbi:hypothetical protein AB0E69_20470 [Kribbella sp. NPDC026611]|uniref:hypothetical protein n=1 Tax=Kribbella sp. NPDC026611 TaxID=3154911 RepID=UPI0033D987B5
MAIDRPRGDDRPNEVPTRDIPPRYDGPMMDDSELEDEEPLPAPERRSVEWYQSQAPQYRTWSPEVQRYPTEVQPHAEAQEEPPVPRPERTEPRLATQLDVQAEAQAGGPTDLPAGVRAERRSVEVQVADPDGAVADAQRARLAGLDPTLTQQVAAGPGVSAGSSSAPQYQEPTRAGETQEAGPAVQQPARHDPTFGGYVNPARAAARMAAWMQTAEETNARLTQAHEAMQTATPPGMPPAGTGGRPASPELPSVAGRPAGRAQSRMQPPQAGQHGPRNPER